jgi:matrixin
VLTSRRSVRLGHEARLWALAAGLGSTIGVGAAAQQAASEHDIGGPWHLSNLHHSQPVIWFVDRTDTTWPVSAAATEWDRSNQLTAGRQAECPDSRDYCPNVHQVNSPDYYGSTTYKLNSAGTHISRDQFFINLSNRTPVGSSRRAVACHELGHALGLDHRQPSNSCMRGGGEFHSLPDSHDFNMLQAMYLHSH